MIEAMLVALPLAAAGTGSALAETRTINVWDTYLAVPTAHPSRRPSQRWQRVRMPAS